jgi:phosphoglycerate dehydrogenase-like enzyme
VTTRAGHDRTTPEEQQLTQRTVVMITTPLEDEHAQRIREAEPERIELIHRPDLLFPARYATDHYKPAGWTRPPEQEAEWRSLLKRAEIAWDFPMADGLSPFDLSPNLKWVQTTSAGVGQLVKRLGAQDSDVIVTTASGVHAEPLSEFVFAALLFHVKGFANILERQRAHRWEKFCGDELDRKTLAIVGPGRIGRQIAKNGRSFGMTVWAMGRNNDPARAAELGVDRLFARDELREMLAGADALVLCAPHTPETEGLLGPDEVAAMKPGIMLVNIARGVIIDEAAMIGALKSGRIAYAALDVFNEEPLPDTSELWDLPNVLVNAHSASNAPSENGKLTDRFIANLRAYLDGRYDEMAPVLDKARMY